MWLFLLYRLPGTYMLNFQTYKYFLPLFLSSFPFFSSYTPFVFKNTEEKLVRAIIMRCWSSWKEGKNTKTKSQSSLIFKRNDFGMLRSLYSQEKSHGRKSSREDGTGFQGSAPLNSTMVCPKKAGYKTKVAANVFKKTGNYRTVSLTWGTDILK